VAALTYRATVDVPARFGKSKSVGAVFGLTSAKYQSGEIDRSEIARHRGMKKAVVVLVRRLAVIMHRIWVDGTELRWTREAVAARHNRTVSNLTGNSRAPPRWWNGVPCGTMDEVSSHVRLDLPSS